MRIPKNLRSFLKNKSWYLQMRYSKFFLTIWLKCRKDVSRDLKDQSVFYKNLLRTIPSKSRMIFDIGANEGFHSEIFKHLGYKVIAVEPSPRNVNILQARFKKDISIKVVPAAVSNHEGTVVFYENENNQALGTISEKRRDEQKDAMCEGLTAISIGSLTLDQLVELYGLPQYIKIDVEGYEEMVLQGLSKTIPVISFEAMLPHYLPECKRCIARLVEINPSAKFNYTPAKEFQLQHFVTGKEITAIIEQTENTTINIFCINV